MRRRGFLHSTAGAVLATALPHCRPRPRRALERIGLQLYTVRGQLARDLDRTLARVAEIGYHEVEFAGYFGRSPATVRAALANAGLAAPAAHVPYESLSDDWDAVLDAATVVGHRYVLVAWIPAAERADITAWRRLADRFNRAAERAAAAGLRFGYHNNDYEFAPLNGLVPYDVLLGALDPTLVTLEMDIFWITKAGGDPLAYLAAHPGRFALMHVKESAGGPEHRMVDLGRGTIDFPHIIAAGRKAGIRHWFAEHDDPADPFGFCREAYAYLAALEA